MEDIASKSIPECFIAYLDDNKEGTSDALLFNTLHKIIYFKHEIADDLEIMLLLLTAVLDV